MMRIAIYHRHDYPTLKSRLKTYLVKLIGRPMIIRKRLHFVNVYGGLAWECLATIKLGSDKRWKYVMEINQLEWCGEREILIIKEMKPIKTKAKKKPFEFR